ncbi:DUF2092 domain-containing protein [Stenotrophomonas sp. PS02289]|uniref:DUF2092 domain-containing protein n=1 Tax=Stenotrophomonas sp. PS02289 TaxID=2991422 RepID=UPI00249B7C30|nr:DUF2092 domain-containing protein [Stenotrophomonas sp. PS02289]
MQLSRRYLLAAAVLACGLLAAPAASAATPRAATATSIDTAIDPAAIAAVEQMGKALRALPKFALTAATRTEYVLDDGQKLSLAGTVNYKVLGADRFFVEIVSDQQHRQLFYDGHTLTLYAPRLKYYTTVDNLDRSSQALVRDAATELGVEFPLADLFLWGTPAFPTTTFQSALRVGSETINGEPTDHFAFRQPGVDWQVWISRRSHLPQQVQITSHNDPALPTYQATLDWDTQRAISIADVTFKPGDATRIAFVPAVAVVTDAAPGDR